MASPPPGEIRESLFLYEDLLGFWEARLYWISPADRAASGSLEEWALQKHSGASGTFLRFGFFGSCLHQRPQ